MSKCKKTKINIVSRLIACNEPITTPSINTKKAQGLSGSRVQWHNGREE
jgi:hypothetical protein